MNTLTGLLVACGSRSTQVVAQAIRGAFVATGAVECEPSPGDFRVRVGRSVGGICLVTDSSIVTFDDAVARALSEVFPVALFAVRDLGYSRGKRRERAAFEALRGWKGKPAKPTVGEIVKLVMALKLWPEPWALEPRPGTTLHFKRPAGAGTFPLRDRASAQKVALEHREASLLLNLRSELTRQGPPPGACETLKAWLPAPLPKHAEAVIASVPNEQLRAELWVSLAGQWNSASLVLDERGARVLASLRSEPPSASTVKRHPSGYVFERAASWLVETLVGRAPAPPPDEVAFAAGCIAARHCKLELVKALELERIVQARLTTNDGAWAAAIMSALGGSLSPVTRRSLAEPAFATKVATAAFSLAVTGLEEAALRCLDAVQEGLSADDDLARWGHAHALWLGVHCRKPSASRVASALRLAGTHAPTLANAIVACEQLGDRARAAEVATRLRAIDKRHAVLKRYR